MKTPPTFTVPAVNVIVPLVLSRLPVTARDEDAKPITSVPALVRLPLNVADPTKEPPCPRVRVSPDWMLTLFASANVFEVVEMNGWRVLPVGMVTSSPAPGTPTGFQFAAVFQSVDVPPTQVLAVGAAGETTRVPLP